MTVVVLTLICLAYVVGLVFTAIPGKLIGLPLGAIALLVGGAIAPFLMPRLWRSGVKPGVWTFVGIVGFCATLYFHVRVPQPDIEDVSRLAISRDVAVGQVAAPKPSTFEIQGRIETAPRLTRSQKIQFEFEASQALEIQANGQSTAPKRVTGRLYVTVPLLQGTGLYPGQQVAVTGVLYKPQGALNPGGFDFQQYLARQGIFAGLRGKRVDLMSERRSPPILWQIRQRIVRSQVTRLGVPEGPLVSAMLMGRGSVDVSSDVRDVFANVGLAHALAASGAQVSLLVGVMLSLTGRLAGIPRLGLCTGVLLIYLGLTGLEPSVLRAGVMGFAALVALTLERKIKPMGSVLLSATLLLLYNPLWIWDLGFQLSFLATIGLLVTVPVLNQWLDWMPTAIAPFVAVPVAAYLWTLPLQLHVFGVVSPYSIVLNILVAPLITVISLGSAMSALIGLIVPVAGSWAAWLLYLPTHLFIQLAEFTNQLPGNAIAIGSISGAQLIALYGLYGLVWQRPRWQRYWWAAGIVAMGLIGIPIGYAYTSTIQATVLATSDAPALVVQNKQDVLLLSGGDEADATYTILPFLKRQGINRIHWAIAPTLNPTSAAGWFRIVTGQSVQTYFENPDFGQLLESSTASDSASRATAQLKAASVIHQEILTQLRDRQGHYIPLMPTQIEPAGAMQIQLVQANPLVLHLHIAEQQWLVLQDLSADAAQKLIEAQQLPQADVLWWSGSEMSPSVLAQILPRVAIASQSIAPNTAAWLQQHQVQTYVTSEAGAVQWSPQTGFVAALNRDDAS
ncbi:ComEC/Rec2 family competence protein [Oscillatoria sp. FACHB-1407]|uniref:ComEC/Rec2 family competence protein n=1 Tax=Oscillatoria sp. FACHB-1407 TaxID=2692847 RepID=UPI001685FAAD|nr:ComEC/Rec2 family competence protein [Oscillatoria sp. FACHB-1407]MBD2462774.1 ComEC/Rec2 family competence protein [Oscillatoria sp. FACHB-1407]